MNISAPKISVLMTVWNGMPYLSEAIESIINQTFEDWEFIIVLNGMSTDGTEDCVKSYAVKDSRIKVIYEPQKGISYGANAGLRQAQGKYIARMDADDIALPHRLQKQWDYMEIHPDIIVSGGFIEYFGHSSLEMGTGVTHEDCLRWIEKGINPFFQSTVIMKRKFIQVLEYRHLSPVEDFDLWCRCSEVGRLGNIPELFVRYRMHPTNSSKSKLSGILSWYVWICYRMRREGKKDYYDMGKQNPASLWSLITCCRSWQEYEKVYQHLIIRSGAIWIKKRIKKIFGLAR